MATNPPLKTHHLLKPTFVSSLFLILLLLNPACYAYNVLYSGQSLGPGEYLVEGFYLFIMQKDCNLVLYESTEPLWASNTAGSALNCSCHLDKYGNLKIETSDSNTLWESKSGSVFSSHFVLVLQKDRNLVIYGGNVWSTSTEINPNGEEGSGVISAISMADNKTVPEVSRV
ncbi:mannose-specific lectin-like [Tasmannia lanceolata]|uniref:mannose-specific lectin-like n=1 Tax=Tasmannia lanceolata TaxID=3420 RepID=UPI004062828F